MGGGNLIAKGTQNIYYHYLGRAWKASAGEEGVLQEPVVGVNGLLLLECHVPKFFSVYILISLW